MISLTTPVTGSAQTGLTSPTYTMVSDVAPDSTSKQWAATAGGGTQTGVRYHAATDPFTTTFFRPKNFLALGKPNPVTGVIKYVPLNKFRHLTRKGTIPLAGQPVVVSYVDTGFFIAAGADTADSPNVRAMLSLHFGAEQQQSAGIGDTVVSGLL